MLHSRLPSKRSDRHSHDAFEDDVHVFGVFEAAEGGDLFGGEIRRQQQFLNSLNLHVADFFLRRATRGSGGRGVRACCGRLCIGSPRPDREPSTGVFANEVQGRRNLTIINRHHIRRLPRLDSQRRNQLNITLSGLAIHQIRQQFRARGSRPFLHSA